ncbi:MAG: glycerol-3-phosphate acyltransferase, partial [Pseudomonadota bacterium]
MGDPFAVGLGALLGYLLGSVPFGLVMAWAFGLGDLRAIGSGNIG